MGLIITLIVIGLILIFAEIFLVPGIGIAGVLGVLSMAGSCYYAFAEFGALAGTIVTVVNVILLVILIVISFRANTWKKLSLQTKIDSKAIADDFAAVQVGERGRAMARLAPAGVVLFKNGKMEARAFEGMINPGAEVEVVMIDDNKIYVKQI
jgi:membrane-bound ClpP family serine protease